MTRARVLGYVRVSTAGQPQDGLSLAAQTERIRAHCVAQDLELVAVVEDAGVSASSLDRSGLTSALGRIRAGEATGLVVTKLDRLTRSVRDLGALIDGGAGTSWSLHSLGDHIDTTTASGRLVLNVLVSVSQWEREATAERTRAVLAHARAQGQHLGNVPFGWRLEKVDRVDGKSGGRAPRLESWSRFLPSSRYSPRSLCGARAGTRRARSRRDLMRVACAGYVAVRGRQRRCAGRWITVATATRAAWSQPSSARAARGRRPRRCATGGVT